MQAHRDRCPACRERAAAILTTATSLAELRAAAVPTSDTNFQDLVWRIEARQRMAARRSASRLRAVSRVGATAMIVLLCGLAAHRYLGRPQTPTDLTGEQPDRSPSASHRGQGDTIRIAAIARQHPSSLGHLVATARRTVGIARALHTLNVTRAGYRRARPVAMQDWSAHPVPTTQTARESGGSFAANTGVRDAAFHAGQENELPGEAESRQAQPPDFVMQTVGQRDDRGVKRAFVIDSIPVTTATGQAGTAAEEAENPATGRAL